MTLAWCLIGSYLLGGIPFGLIVAKLLRGVDIRRLGSGNIGATNVLRAVGWKGGVLVLLLDALKGFLPVLLTKAMLGSPLAAILAGLAAMLGHSFSPFLRFTGGRGVATGLGVVLALSWKAGGCAFGLALLLMCAFRYVSLGSIVGAAALPFLMALFKAPSEYVIFAALAATLIILRHLPNIRRLRAGTESKLGEKRAVETAPEADETD